MNILEQEDMVKGMPDEVLIAQSQNPTGRVPQFLLVSEIQRREKMRADYQANQQVPEQTIADQVLQQGIASVNPMPDPLMNAAMGVPQQPMMPQQARMTAAGGGMMPYRMAMGRGVPNVNSLEELQALLASGQIDKSMFEQLLSNFSSNAAKEDLTKLDARQVTSDLIDMATSPNTGSSGTANSKMTGIDALELLNEVEARRMAQRQGSDIGGVPFGPMAVETGSLGSPISKDSPTFIEALRGQPVYDDQGNIVSREGGPAMFAEYLESIGAINPKDVREQNLEKFLTTGVVGDVRRATGDVINYFKDPNEGLSEREIAAREDYKKSQETDFVKLAQDQLAQDDQEAVPVVKAAEQTAKKGDTSKEDLESVIASMFGRSYKPTDEGALALINLGAGIAKGDLGAGLAGAGQAIVGERDRRRKDMLAAAQAKYYATAGERSNKLSYQDVLETARKEYKAMDLKDRQALYKQVYGKDPSGDDLRKAEGQLTRILADQVAIRERSPAYAGGDPLATSRANPNIVPPESLYRFGRSLGLNVE